MMSLKRQHSKKGNFVSSNAGLLERDFGYSYTDTIQILYDTAIVVETDYRTSSLKSRGRYRQLSQSAVLYNSTPLSCWITTKYSKIIRN